LSDQEEETQEGKKENIKNFRAKIAVMTVCDEKGNLLLEPGDADLLAKNISASRLVKIADAANKLNKVREEDKEELTKNSADGQPVNSISGFAKS
jgi:glutamate mutase epsilon subunit